jgi:AcrR family transcriptional regulator
MLTCLTCEMSMTKPIRAPATRSPPECAPAVPQEFVFSEHLPDEPVSRKLPRGLTSLPREVAEAQQKRRLITATARAVAEKGYADATVADITSFAGVSRKTFYALFQDKEACFLYGFEKLSEALLKAVSQALRPDLPLPEQLRSALTAYLQRIEADQSLARAFFAEAESATARSRAAFIEVNGRFVEQMEWWLSRVRKAHPEVPKARPADFSMVTAGLTGYVIAHMRDARPFSEDDVNAMFRFILASLSLYGWAAHVPRQ